MKNALSWSLLLLFVFALISPPCMGKKKTKKRDGAAIFAQYCAQCHTAGGNIVKSSKPIVGSKQLGSLPQFKAYLDSPPGHMPHYQELLNDKHALQSLYQYCKKLQATPVKQS